MARVVAMTRYFKNTHTHKTSDIGRHFELTKNQNAGRFNLRIKQRNSTKQKKVRIYLLDE